jgi:hypothetical protein
MTKTIPELEKLATKHIGLKGSPLVFVVVDGSVVAVFVGREFLHDAEALAHSIDRDGLGADQGGSNAVCVEDKDGVGWENELAQEGE